MNTLPSCKKIIAATFVSDLPTIKGLIVKDFSPFIELSDKSVPSFPVWGITESQRWILGGDWTGNKYEPLVNSLLQKNQDVMSFWKDEMRLPIEAIDYQRYTELFYADNPLDSSEKGERDKYISEGNRPIDVDLWIAVNTFDYKEVERLLKAGADPEVDYDSGINCRDRIATECGYLDACTHIYDKMFRYEKTGIIPKQIDNMTMNNLIGFAAHEKMYALMKPYFKE